MQLYFYSGGPARRDNSAFYFEDDTSLVPHGALPGIGDSVIAQADTNGGSVTCDSWSGDGNMTYTHNGGGTITAHVLGGNNDTYDGVSIVGFVTADAGVTLTNCTITGYVTGAGMTIQNCAVSGSVSTTGTSPCNIGPTLTATSLALNVGDVVTGLGVVISGDVNCDPYFAGSGWDLSGLVATGNLNVQGSAGNGVGTTGVSGGTFGSLSVRDGNFVNGATFTNANAINYILNDGSFAQGCTFAGLVVIDLANVGLQSANTYTDGKAYTDDGGTTLYLNAATVRSVLVADKAYIQKDHAIAIPGMPAITSTDRGTAVPYPRYYQHR